MAAPYVIYGSPREEFIALSAQFRKMNEESESTGEHAEYRDRSCGVCGTTDPEQRVWANECCHVVCSGCAEGKTKCPLCEVPTSFQKLFEEKSCGICACQAPLRMGIFYGCGHTVCGACGPLLLLDSMDKGELFVSCPFCRIPSGLCAIWTKNEKN